MNDMKREHLYGTYIITYESVKKSPTTVTRNAKKLVTIGSSNDTQRQFQWYIPTATILM
jgi:hypothetical protein